MAVREVGQCGGEADFDVGAVLLDTASHGVLVNLFSFLFLFRGLAFDGGRGARLRIDSIPRAFHIRRSRSSLQDFDYVFET